MRKLLLPLLLLAMTLAAQGYYMMVHNPNSQDLRNFQVRVKLSAELVGKPISMTDQLGNPVPFCYETGVGECTTDPTQGDGYIWVKVPNIPANGDTKLIVQVGTNGAVKGDQVFDFYDDFNEGSLNTNKWKVIEGSVEFDNGILVLNKPQTYQEVVTKNFNILNGVVEVRWKWKYGGSWFSGGLFLEARRQPDGATYAANTGGYCNGFEIFYDSDSDRSDWDILVKSYGCSDLYEDKWYRVSFVVYGDHLKAIFKSEYDGGKPNLVVLETTDDRINKAGAVGIGGWQYEYFDWIRVRKYAPQEPTVTFEVYKEVPQQVALIQPTQPSVFKAYQELVTIYNEVSKSSGYKATLLKGPFQSNIIYLATLAQLNDVYNRFNMFKQELIQSITELKELMKKEPTFDNVYKMMNLVQRCKVDLAMMKSTLQQMKQIVEEMKASIPAVTCDYKKAKEIILGILNAKTIEEIVKYRLEASKMGGLDKVVKCLFKYTMEKTIKDFTEFEEKAKKELNEYGSKLKEYEMIVKLLSVR